MINPKTILVVDDHEDSRMIYSTILQHYGYITLSARDGEEALRLIRKYGPHAVVTDLHIPRLDGCEPIKAARQDPATAHIRTILITADALPEARQQAEEAGCDVFLLKPSQPHHLVHKVQEMIGTARSQLGVAYSHAAEGMRRSRGDRAALLGCSPSPGILSIGSATGATPPAN